MDGGERSRRGREGEVLVGGRRRVVRRSCVGEEVERATSLRKRRTGGSSIGRLHLRRRTMTSPL
jgi:hypothetical protein